MLSAEIKFPTTTHEKESTALPTGKVNCLHYQGTQPMGTHTDSSRTSTKKNVLTATE